MRASSPRPAFTLIELLVVLAIIAILIALLLPAIQASREAGRNSTCRSNMHQLGIAMLSYHDVYKKFPPGGQALPTGQYFPSIKSNWVCLLLPYMEEQNLYDTINWKTYMTQGAVGGVPYGLTAYNPAAGGVVFNSFTSKEISSLLCPSDVYNQTKWKVSRYTSAFGSPPANSYQTYGRLNYAANACLAAPFKYSIIDPAQFGTDTNAYPCGTPEMAGWAIRSPWSWNTRGVMGLDASVGMRQITDGTSTTALLWEIRGGISEGDFRGSWADGRPAASTIWFHVFTAPNNCTSADDCGDGIAAALAGSVAFKRAECMPLTTSQSGAVSGTPRSMHPGGVNAVFCDASVRFVSDLIEIRKPNLNLDADYGGIYGWNKSPNAADIMLTWQRINCSADGLPVEEEKLNP